MISHKDKFLLSRHLNTIKRGKVIYTKYSQGTINLEKTPVVYLEFVTKHGKLYDSGEIMLDMKKHRLIADIFWENLKTIKEAKTKLKTIYK